MAITVGKDVPAVLAHARFPTADLTLVAVEGFTDLRLSQERMGSTCAAQLAQEEDEHPAFKAIARLPI